MTASDARTRGLWFLVAGFAVWASALAMLYGFQALGCELGWDAAVLGPVSGLRLLLSVIWAAHLVVLAWLYGLCLRRAAQGWFGRSPTASFLSRAGIAITAAAFVATIVTGVAMPGATMCS